MSKIKNMSKVKIMNKVKNMITIIITKITKIYK